MIKKINNYQILSKIASGGMANIYLAQDTRTGIKVAIKILKDEVSDKEKIYERFSQEGLLNLNHPNIVKILDAGVHENTSYIVMEYIDGRDLEDLIKSRNKLSVNEALSIFTQLLSALAYVHNKGIIHRDIKPKNILIDKSGTAKLTDFGIAKSIYSHVKTSTGGYLGAPAYSSPEQMDGLSVDNRSDIYSLGITLYEMLAGVTPFSSASIPSLIKEKFTGKYRQISTYRSDVPPHIISIIARCIAVSPKDRFGSVVEILNALSKYENNKTIIRETTPKPVNSTKKLVFISSSVGIVMLIIIIILAVKLSSKAENTVDVVTETSAKTAMEKAEYDIGDTGPAGGLIFYVNPDNEADGWKYLEAAPSDQSTGIQWYNGSYVTTNATATAVGIGQANTQTIVNIQGSGTYAAQLCNDLTVGGYSDWFLPSKDELKEMYVNLYLKGLGGFASDYYWSSSENDAYPAWYQAFYSGAQGSSGKGAGLLVRAARAF
ncbi:MAG: protein kinase domain-containing protein [Candidatus Humimicrobiaceae bacterium]